MIMIGRMPLRLALPLMAVSLALIVGGLFLLA